MSRTRAGIENAMGNVEQLVVGPSNQAVADRARASGGSSSDAIYRMIANELRSVEHGPSLLDVGCGKGNLWQYLKPQFRSYTGADVVFYDGFPAEGRFVQFDADAGRLPLPDEVADVVVAAETIEHVENPRAFMRELIRLARPGGAVVVTTPNQLSWLSKMTLLLKNEFSAFRAGSYPAHLTALLEVDLRRIATECGVVDIRIAHSLCGRVVLTPWHFPTAVSRMLPRALSDNVLLLAIKD